LIFGVRWQPTGDGAFPCYADLRKSGVALPPSADKSLATALQSFLQLDNLSQFLKPDLCDFGYRIEQFFHGIAQSGQRNRFFEYAAGSDFFCVGQKIH
jgi:hypothetical protein